MKIYEATKNEFLISTDKRKLDIQFIQNYLCNESYWAKNIPLVTVKKSIEGSLCFGLYVREKENISQVGFARVVSDHATFAYLADVFIIEKFRGKGLSKWMMGEIMIHPELQGLRRWLLATRDAHGLYTKFGFLPLDKPELIMRFKPFEEYPKTNS
ncbi:MAG: GNAT family N-acetyltransferase [Ferruginibacter sp.]